MVQGIILLSEAFLLSLYWVSVPDLYQAIMTSYQTGDLLGSDFSYSDDSGVEIIPRGTTIEGISLLVGQNRLVLCLLTPTGGSGKYLLGISGS